VTPEILESASDSETEAIGESLPKRFPGRTLFFLEGDLGAGKTTLVRGLARAFGVDPQDVSSPTFALLHEYGEGAGGWPRLRHLDLYRIDDAASLQDVGVLQVLDDPVPVAVEWPAAAFGVFRNAVRVRIEKTGDETRRLTLTG
jgi:tRNA threonylcarbamoyladenosine biosynthesis protein TsaE